MPFSRLVDDEAYREDDLRPIRDLVITQTFASDAPPPAAPAPRSGLAILRKLFGAKKLTLALLDEQITALQAEAATAESLKRNAEAQLAAPGALTAAEHRQADQVKRDAELTILRVRDALDGLAAERSRIAADEARAAVLRDAEVLTARAGAARKRWDRYGEAARQIADELSAIRKVRDGIEMLRRKASALGLSIEIESPTVYRIGADLLDVVNLPALDGADHWRMDEAFMARRLANLA